MAVLNYSNIFARLEPLVLYFNILETRQTSILATDYPIPYIRNEIEGPFASQDMLEELTNFASTFTTHLTSIDTLKSALITWAENIMRTVGVALDEQSTNVEAVVQRLGVAMAKDSYYVTSRDLQINSNDLEAGDASDGTIVPHTDNTGTGVLVFSFTNEDGVDSQLPEAEIISIECVAAVTLGSEIFQVNGSMNNGDISYLGTGSGSGPSLVSLGNSLTDNYFETWSGTPKVLDNWSLDAGAWGTDCEQDTDAYKGSYCIELNAAGSNIKLTQAFTSKLKTKTPYLVGVWAKKAAGATGHVYLEVADVNGTAVSGYTALDIDVATDLTTSYTFHWAVILTSGSTGTDWLLQIRTDTIAVADVFIDYIQFGEMIKHNNIYWALASGSVDWHVGDKFGFGSDWTGIKVEVGGGNDGVWQRFFGRVWGKQLPSSGASLIAEPS